MENAVAGTRIVAPLAVASIALLLSCSRGGERASDADPPSQGDTVAKAQASDPPPAPSKLFTEITDLCGLDFTHDTGMDPDNPTYLLPECMSAGAALFDMDRDGDLDVYLINGARSGAGDGPGPASDRLGAEPLRNRLFRNDGCGGSGAGFVDVTADSGLGDTGYGMGVAIGDIDNDGDEDVYLTNYGPDALYRNNGDGTFSNITEQAGIRGDGWSVSTAFFDYDGDGYLDLFVTNFVEFDPTIVGRDESGWPDYTGPQLFQGVADRLWHNNGDGTFTDVSGPSGIGAGPGPGLGVGLADFNDDGHPDVYVANDGEANRLWINQGGAGAVPSFVDHGLLGGSAYNMFGEAEASMGVTLGDIDGDGDLDVFLTHLGRQSNTLYLNTDGVQFFDRTAASALGAPSMDYTGFGTALMDYDHDGDLDLAVVNGRVRRHLPFEGANVGEYWKHYAEPNLLFENSGAGSFHDVSTSGGRFCSLIEVSRGLATGDFDDDGDLDMLVTNGGGRARLFRNDAPKKGTWLMVRAYDPELNRDAIGAVVEVVAGGRRFRRDINRGFSYLCSGDPRAHFGLGAAQRVEQITVRWPDGDVEEFAGGEANRLVLLSKGDGSTPGE